jgi:hypothetical protein
MIGQQIHQHQVRDKGDTSMNNALTVVLIIAVICLSAVLALKNRYVVISSADSGTVIVDRWGDFKTPGIITQNKQGKWVLNEVVRGGETVLRFEAGMDAEPEPPERPEI